MTLVEVPAAQRASVPRHEETHLQVRWDGRDETRSSFIAGDLHNGIYGGGRLLRVRRSQRGFTACGPRPR